jgi:translation initiation factor IF-1
MIAHGTVTDLVRNALLVALDNGFIVRCTLAGKLQINRVRVVAGDWVAVEMNGYDLHRGRIVWRGK